MTDNDDDDTRRMAQNDKCWDGNWMAEGLSGMMISLDDPDFCDDELEEFQDDLEDKPHLTMEQEFLQIPQLDGADDSGTEDFRRLRQHILQPRHLHLCDGVVRRVAEGSCPPRIRIRKLESEEMDELLERKRLGNEAFGTKDYEKAIEHYDEALLFAARLYVAPADQIKEVVNVLSNQAECHLRLKQFKEAGSVATHALLFNNSHEKSRMRRAKAALYVAGVSYLVQAQVDLEEIVENHYSRAGVNEAQEYLEQLEELLEMERVTFEKKNPDSDWSLYIRLLRSKCW